MAQNKIHKRVAIFEAEGGSDKTWNGHRKDTVPIVEAFKEIGWTAEVIFFRDEWKEAITKYVIENCDAYIPRINTGNLPNGEAVFNQALREMCAAGVVGTPHPDTLMKYDSKLSLVDLNKTPLSPADTVAYFKWDDLVKNFPTSLTNGERVLKQNRGSTGEGIWRVQVGEGVQVVKGQALPLDTKIKCTEAVDNHVEHHTLESFFKLCEKYYKVQENFIIDMRFLPRIKEGEVRIFLMGTKPLFVIHKKPADKQDAFSATLFSGATYKYESPEAWPELIKFFTSCLQHLTDNLGDVETILDWTCDFILDTDENGKDKYWISEVNVSCIGFTNQLDIGILKKIFKIKFYSFDKRKNISNNINYKYLKFFIFFILRISNKRWQENQSEKFQKEDLESMPLEIDQYNNNKLLISKFKSLQYRRLKSLFLNILLIIILILQVLI